MFGATKIKVKNRVVYVTNQYGFNKIFNSKGKLILMYSIDDLGLCSIKIVQNISFPVDKQLAIAYFKQEMLTGYSKTMVSFQNVTKSSYFDLIALGFIDIYRLPGSYTNESGIKGKKSNCLSLMVLDNGKLTDAVVESIKLLAKINN